MENQRNSNIDDINEYIAHLSNDPIELSNLLSSLYISYTEFFRNTLTYYYLKNEILRKLTKIKGDSEIRICVNGCSTGEEAYCIAMLIEEHNAKHSINIKYRIFATDINALNIEYANKGVYDVSKVQNLKVKYLNNYFTKKNNCYYIKEELKRNISFTIYDLFDINSKYPTDSIYGSFDIVTCCNIMYYYTIVHQDFIADKLINSISEQGYFITDESEKSNMLKYKKIQYANPYIPIYQLRNEVVPNET